MASVAIFVLKRAIKNVLEKQAFQNTLSGKDNQPNRKIPVELVVLKWIRTYDLTD